MASNDFVISTNLVVFGMSTFTGGLTFDGAMILDVDSTEALLVRKDSDGGDVFTVNTSGDLVTLGASTDLLWASEDGDIGASSATRPANVHVKSTVVIGDDETAGYGITIGDNHQGHAPLWIVGSFASDGAQSFSAVSAWNMSLTGFAGDTVLAGLHVVNSITTQGATEVLTNVASLFIDEPNITVGTGDTITNADTLLITGEPTEGVTNAALRVAAGHVILPSENDANTPTLSFGDGDSGFYEQGDDSIQLALAGGSSVRWNTTSMRSLVNGSWNLSHAVASGTVPPYNFQGDTNTGMGKNAADQLSLIAGGVEVLRLSNATEFAQSRWSGAFTSDGSSNLATGALFGSDVTSADGDTALSQVRMGGTNVGGSLTTPGTGQSLFAATLWLDEPDITLSGGDSMTTSATLYISGAPTEGTSNNFALFVDNGAARFDGVLDMKENSTFSNPAKTFTFGSGVPQTYAHVAIIGAFTSSGLSNQAAHLYIAGTLTGANGDTVSLAALKLQNSITTQGTSNTITDVAQIVCHEPVITVGAGDTITNASTLVLFGSPTEGTNNFSIRSTGPAPALFTGAQFVIGQSTVDDNWQLLIAGNFTSGGSGTEATKLRVEGTLTGAAGDTTALMGAHFNATITTQTATENIANISGVQITNPVINDNLTGDITHAQSLLLLGSPGAGEANWALRSTGSAPSIFAGRQFAIGATSIFDYQQFTIAGSFTSGGGAAQADKFKLQDPLIGASGDIQLVGAFLSATVTTQTAAEVVTNVAQMRIQEPNITLGAGSSITDAQTLLISGSPTEGNDNWTLRSTGAAPSIFEGLQFIIGDFAVDDYHQVLISGSFTSGGASDRAAKLRLEGILTGASGDTNSINGSWFDASIVTQTATESIADISQVRIDEPVITDNLTGDITIATTLHLVGSPTEGESNFALKSTGPAPTQFGGQQFVIGTNVVPVADFWQVLIRGNFTSGGTSNRAAKFHVEEGLTGASGDTTFLVGADFDASITTQTAAEVVAEVAQVRIDEPQITLGAGSSITNASTLLIAGAPTEGVTNDALRIVSGSTQFPGGSAAAPSIRFGNVGTGIYQNTTNDVLVTIDGVSLIKVTDSGSVNRLSFHSDLALTWTSGAAEGGGPQFALIRESTAESQSSVGDLALSSGADFTVYKERGSSSSYHRTSIRHREETLSNVSGASVTTTITAIPDGALVLGVTTTVEVALGTSNGTTGYQVGDGTDADRWGDITGTSTLTESDDADFTVATVDRFTSSGEVTITAVGGNFDGTGDILVVVHFLEIGANRP